MRNYLDNIGHVYQRCLPGSQQAGRCIYFVNGVKGLWRSPESVPLPAHWPLAPSVGVVSHTRLGTWMLTWRLSQRGWDRSRPEAWGGLEEGARDRHSLEAEQRVGFSPGVLDLQSPPPPPPPHRLSAVPPAGQVGLGWPRAELFKPPALIPSASQHGCACSFRPSKTLAKKNKENDLSAVIYTVNLLWSDFFPRPACSNLLRKIK